MTVLQSGILTTVILEHVEESAFATNFYVKLQPIGPFLVESEIPHMWKL